MTSPAHSRHQLYSKNRPMMIIPATSRSLCQGCRINLQVLFERGFCAATTTSKAPHFRSRQRQLQPRISTRTLSHQIRLFAAAGPIHTDVLEEAIQGTSADDNAADASQAAVLEQLEKELGKPLEQAIAEDEISAELISKYKAIVANLPAEAHDSISDADRVVNLRNAGVPLADIIRAVRQVNGDVLPHNLLNDEELALYRRLYGEPVMRTEQEQNEAKEAKSDSPNKLLSPEGEEIHFRAFSQDLVDHGQSEDGSRHSVNSPLRSSNPEEVARSVGGIIFEENGYEDEEEINEEEHDEHTGFEKGHPLTRMGKFGTNPRTVFLPQETFVKPVERILSSFSNKQLKEVSERTFGGPGLPDSPLTPRSARARQQVPIPLDVNQNTMGTMEANAYIATVMPPTYASIISVLVETRKRLGATWLNSLLSRKGGPRVLDAGAGGAGVLAWREIVDAHWNSLHSSDKRTPPAPPTKAVVLTGSDGLRHRAAELLENTTFVPRLPDYVHSRTSPTLEDDRPSQQKKQFDVIIAPHTLFNIKEDWLKKQQVQNLWTMLSDQGGVLILIEKGVPRGFEAIAGAREMLLERHISVPEGQSTHYSKFHSHSVDDGLIHKKETGMIVAPCTNHEKCPMYTTPGLSRGRKTICSFQQRYIRPPFLQRVLGAKDRNHDDVDFSYISVMKGDDIRLRDTNTWDRIRDPLSAPVHPNTSQLSQNHDALLEEFRTGYEDYNPETDKNERQPYTKEAENQLLPTFQSMPRIINAPFKRRGHVTIDLCTPLGKIERWTVPKSFSRQAYRDARKSKWGDLWALGAKTQIASNLKLGSPEKTLIGPDGEIFKGKGRGSKERLKIKALKIHDRIEEERMNDIMEQNDMMAALDAELNLDEELLPKSTTLDIATGAKPMNNRERKAARRAAREAQKSQNTTPADADLSFRPRSRRPKEQSLSDDMAMDHAMSEWQSEHNKSANFGNITKGRAFNKFNKNAKAANRF